MRIHELSLTSSRRPTRPGRGIGGGRGKTAGRGTKGQNSRSGGGVRPGFEGGQNPLTARLPKLPGFTSRRRLSQSLSVGSLTRVRSKEIDNVKLREAGLIADQFAAVKLVAGGELNTAKIVRVAAASSGALKQLEAAGGSFSITKVPTKAAKAKPKKAKPA